MRVNKPRITVFLMTEKEGLERIPKCLNKHVHDNRQFVICPVNSKLLHWFLSSGYQLRNQNFVDILINHSGNSKQKDREGVPEHFPEKFPVEKQFYFPDFRS